MSQIVLPGATIGVLGSLVDLPVYIALDRGYFTEEGLELNLAEFNSAADMIPLLATDQLLNAVWLLTRGTVPTEAACKTPQVARVARVARVTRVTYR